MNKITFIEGASGLGAPLPGQDYISGYAHYTTASLPVGFTVSQVQEIFSVANLESLGVTASNNDYGVIHYNVSEYFRQQPQGQLYVGIFTTNSGGSYNELTTVQSQAGGSIRQMLVYDTVSFNQSLLTTLQTVVTANYNNYKPFEVVYQPQLIGLTLSTLPSLHTSSAQNVSVCIGQDGAGVGAALATTIGKTVGCGGTVLGTIAAAAVNQSIAWVGAPYGNIDSGTEFDTLAFGNGQLYANQTDGLISQLDGDGYIFALKQIGIQGSYFNNAYTATVASSDYAYIYHNRTINKAIRNLRTFLLPTLASPIPFNADGTIRQDVIGYFNSLCQQALDQMVRNTELSAYKVVINPTQNVLSTQTLTLNLSLVPVGVANNIVVNIGFTLSV